MPVFIAIRILLPGVEHNLLTMLTYQCCTAVGTWSATGGAGGGSSGGGGTTAPPNILDPETGLLKTEK
jgi:hypothetical protein